MKLWRYTRLDVIMLVLSLAQFVTTPLLAHHWDHASTLFRIGIFPLIAFMITYNTIVVTHLFTHTRWFWSARLNALASALNSINIGQSVQVYQLTHVRNHHRYNNDEKEKDGTTNDLSSTYRDGIGGNHDRLFHYAFVGALSVLPQLAHDIASLARLGKVSVKERDVLDLVANSLQKRAHELRQVQIDRMAGSIGFCLLVAISWKWALICYLPALYLARALVNIQNYYEHYGAAPASRYTDSVSYYGPLYNLLTFNDGYHQEHHLRPQAHWRTMPAIRRDHHQSLNQVERVVSPVPAILGFLHRNRPQLHRISQPGPGLESWQEPQGSLSKAAASAKAS